jgi:hypothetical protein
LLASGGKDPFDARQLPFTELPSLTHHGHELAPCLRLDQG